ncbi:MAG: disulfide bond formation protein B [Aestuariivirga sp.]
MLEKLNPQKTSLVILAVTTATIAGAWLFQLAGYDPCHLCLLQRWAYYFAIPFSLLLSVSAGANAKGAQRGLYFLAVIMLGSAVFGAYHAGVEWKWWSGPETCSGDISGGLPDLTKKVVACNEAAIRIFGLSLAGWNAVISLLMAAVALKGARHHGSSSVSQ